MFMVVRGEEDGRRLQLMAEGRVFLGLKLYLEGEKAKCACGVK